MTVVEDRPDDELEAVYRYLTNDQNYPFYEKYFVTHSPNEIFVWEKKTSVEDPDFPFSHPTSYIEDEFLWKDSIENVLRELVERGYVKH